MSRRSALLATVAWCATASTPAMASTVARSRPAAGRLRTDIWEDDFSSGFSTDGPGAKWAFLPFGAGVGQDGVATTSSDGLRIVSSGTHSGTGKPAFKLTVGQNDPGGLPGSLDHVKYLVYANVKGGSGQLGFDVDPGEELICESWMSGVTYGTEGHPFGSAVLDAAADPRLASSCLAMEDLDTAVAFEFSLTNEFVYVYYERLPNNREKLGNYASFLYSIPVARRAPDDQHHVKISYDRSRGLVRWFLEGKEVFRVDKIGHLLPSRRYLVSDHGGTEEKVEPRQLACGMGMFNILDAAQPGRAGSGLVRLNTDSDFYYDPVVGPPRAETFVDEVSLVGNRLFGQGASLHMRKISVTTKRAGLV
ncbi:DUF6081 family protein [Streptomyces kronopolitis]|uniref:DUF6081 family protein n=1 Tax=Streptomyces kronopolitis TaxID=1612435 RepID=UPI003D952A0F